MSERLTGATADDWVRQTADRLVAALLHASLRLTPWPTAMVMRRQFAAAGAERARVLRPAAPSSVAIRRDEPYAAGRDTLLDLYLPKNVLGTGLTLPVLVWTHGGAYVGGSKDELDYYFQAIAATGVAVVAIRYSLAPGQKHPTPVRQLLAALRYVGRVAPRMHIDPTRIALGGDSAGAQITVQAAAAITNSSYADMLHVRPGLPAHHLRAVVLCCGIYDVTALPGRSGFGDYLLAAGWAYSGTRNYRTDAYFTSAMSLANLVTARFPPAFLTAGNADPLSPQSAALARLLDKHGVTVDTLFYSPGHSPALGHEYQFDLGLPDGRIALGRIVDFLSDHLAPQESAATT